MIKASIQYTRVEDRLMRLYARAKDSRSLLRKIAGDMLKDTHDNFDTQGHGKWKKLRASTIDRRTKKGKWGQGSKMLKVTGRLYTSVKAKSTDKYAIVGTNVRYAGIHQFGGKIRPPGGTPYVNFDSKYTAKKMKGRITGKMGEKLGGQQMRFLKKDGNYPEGVKFTKPHNITIPARPFLDLQPKTISMINNRVAMYFAGRSDY